MAINYTTSSKTKPELDWQQKMFESSGADCYQCQCVTFRTKFYYHQISKICFFLHRKIWTSRLDILWNSKFRTFWVNEQPHNSNFLIVHSKRYCLQFSSSEGHSSSLLDSEIIAVCKEIIVSLLFTRDAPFSVKSDTPICWVQNRQAAWNFTFLSDVSHFISKYNVYNH